MNNEQFEALRATTNGHTPGPWEWKVIGSDSMPDIELCAAAPDLLAEVARLRGFLECIAKNGAPISKMIAQDALNGAEVPK